MMINTLTTDLGLPCDSVENLTNTAMNNASNGQVNTVVSKLVKNWRKLVSSECNVRLFRKLLSNDISTRDIYSFVKKQADLKKVHKVMDKPMTKAAMKSKLKDACAFSVRQRRIVNKLKMDLLKATGNKRYTQKRIIRQVKTKIDLEKSQQMQNDDQKFQRYLSLQSRMVLESQSKMFQVPASADQFKDIKAFNVPSDPIAVIDRPVVYDKSIILSDDEMQILSKGPKFAVRQKLVKESFKVESEKMSCKQKFTAGDEFCEGQPTSNVDVQSSFVVQSQSQDDSAQAKPDRATRWEEKRAQLVYDFTEGSLDPGRLKATDYKFNKSTNLPKPSSADVEAKHDLRKKESLAIFDKVVSNPSSKSKTPYACKSNLTPSELRGLKSLQKRVADGSIVVCESDKSVRVCVMSREQYLAAGFEHCKKDLEVSHTEVKRLQKYVNANVEWMHEIFGSGSFWGHEERIISSSNDAGSQVAPLRLLIKDHKQYNPASDKVIPTRPVVNGKGGFNCHLSELLSMILGPVAKESMGSEINSTGDLLSIIENVNSKISSNKAYTQPSMQTNISKDSIDDKKQVSAAVSADFAADFSYCDHCSNCNIQAPTQQELQRAKCIIDKTVKKNVNSAMNVTNVLKQKLRASREATKLYHRCWVKSPDQDQDESDARERDQESSLPIGPPVNNKMRFQRFVSMIHLFLRVLCQSHP